MNEFYLSAIGFALFLLASLLLGTMAAVAGVLERIRKIEETQAGIDSEPIRTLISEAREIQARLLADEEERSMEAENG